MALAGDRAQPVAGQFSCTTMGSIMGDGIGATRHLALLHEMLGRCQAAGARERPGQLGFHGAMHSYTLSTLRARKRCLVGRAVGWLQRQTAPGLPYRDQCGEPATGVSIPVDFFNRTSSVRANASPDGMTGRKCGLVGNEQMFVLPEHRGLPMGSGAARAARCESNYRRRPAGGRAQPGYARGCQPTSPACRRCIQVSRSRNGSAAPRSPAPSAPCRGHHHTAGAYAVATGWGIWGGNGSSTLCLKLRAASRSARTPDPTRHAPGGYRGSRTWSAGGSAAWVRSRAVPGWVARARFFSSGWAPSTSSICCA